MWAPLSVARCSWTESTEGSVSGCAVRWHACADVAPRRQPRGFRAEVALMWRHGGGATSARSAPASGPMVVGAARLGGDQRGHEKKEGGEASMMSSPTRRGEDGGGRRRGRSGRRGSVVGESALRWSPGEGDARTRIAARRRCRWWRWRGRGDGDGGARGGGVFSVAGGEILKSGEVGVRGDEWVVEAG